MRNVHFILFGFLCLFGCNPQGATPKSGSVYIEGSAPTTNPTPTTSKTEPSETVSTQPKKSPDVEPKPKPAPLPPEKEDEAWPKLVIDPPTEPKALDPKIVDEWKKAGAKSGWSTAYQYFDYKPDFKYYPEMLPYIEMKTFKAEVIEKLTPPDGPFYLSLFGADLKDDDLKVLSKLKNLRRLNLGSIYTISGTTLSSLTKLPDLRNLYLYSTTVTNDGLKEICQIKTLRYLDIGNSRITEEALGDLINLRELQSLGLYNITLSDKGMKAVSRCQHLTELNLTRTTQTGEGMKALGKLKSLEKLNMTGTSGDSRSDDNLKGISNLKNLKHLNLGGNHDLTDACTKEIGELKSLLNLNLRITKITDEGLKNLASLAEINELYLNGIQCTDKGLPHLSKLKNLETLNLAGTKVTEAGLKTILAYESEKLKSVSMPLSVSKEALAGAQKERPKVSFKY